MGRVADHSLVEIADLNGQGAVGAGDRTKIADVAVAADPDRRTVGQRDAIPGAEPLVELRRAAPDIGVGRGSHLAVTLGL